MNNLNEIINKYQTLIREHNKDEGVVFTLIEFLTGIYKTELFLKDNIEIDEELLEKYVLEYCNGQSIQYITNEAYFLGRKFYVDNRVLIPRFETEEVVLKAIEIIKSNDITNVFEVGSGSGIIAITLNLECEVNVDSVDISSEALAVANKNNQDLNATVKFFPGNVLDDIEDKYEMIISNPPYIPCDGFVAKETLENEPHLALFGGTDGLDFYRKIIEDSKKLKDLKFIVFEIGFDQGSSLKELCNNVEIIRDINGNERIAIIDMRR